MGCNWEGWAAVRFVILPQLALDISPISRVKRMIMRVFEVLQHHVSHDR